MKVNPKKTAWNKGKSLGQKRAFTKEQVALIEQLLVAAGGNDYQYDKIAVRNLALLRAGVDTMLRASDLLQLRVGDIFRNNYAVSNFYTNQQKTNTKVYCILLIASQAALTNWLKVGWENRAPNKEERVFALSTRQYARIVKGWAEMIHLDPELYSTHSIRRTKSREIYRTTQNLEVVKQLLGHSSLVSTYRYLGVTQEDADEIARNTRI